jgi:hypothetical protein
MPTLYMRIGSDKAGTVTLARLVERNRDVFLRHNVNAPPRNCVALLDHFVTRHNLRTIDVFGSKASPAVDKRAHEFAEFMEHYPDFKEMDIFLTTETFWGRLSKKDISARKDDISTLCTCIKDFFYNHAIKIILHLRRVDLYIESLYKQRIKSNQFVNMERLKKSISPQKCMALLGILEDVFGKENLIVRPFERSRLLDNDLVADTLGIMGLYDQRGEFASMVANEGLHRDLCETLLVLNREHGKLLDNKALLELSNILTKDYKFTDYKFILSRAERVALYSAFEEFYSYLARTYNNGNAFFVEPFPNDAHPGYSLSRERFATIRELVMSRLSSVA